MQQQSTVGYLAEISSRVKSYRIDYPMTQKELADKSGISVRSIARFEAGEDIQFSNLIKILCALELENNLELLVPDPKARPSYYLVEEESRRRASSKNKTAPIGSQWKWGDEQ